MNNHYQVPMTTFNHPPFYDINISHAIGEYVYDQNGKRFIDLRSGLWNVSLGYHSDWLNTIKEKLNQTLNDGMFYLDIHSYNHPIYNEYAIRLLDFINSALKPHLPAYQKVIYTNSGSEGTELALKLACYTLKKKIIAFKEGYHGTFKGGMSVSGIDSDMNLFYGYDKSDVTFFDAPTNRSTLNTILEYIERNSTLISSIIIEPTIGSGGCITLSADSLNQITKICKENNILTIFDEVATGFFRTGERFAHSSLEYIPDLIILSKSINNGFLPFGAVILGDTVSKLLRNRHIEHFSTQNGNLLSMYSANETLSFFIQNESTILENLRVIESTSIQTFKHFGLEFDGVGAMFSLKINNIQLTFRIVNELKEMGIIVYYYVEENDERPRSGITIFPPLLIEIRKYQQALRIICKKIKHFLY
ncbi:aminotransferase class III-fold pyridoxal phosphate-dependent enzyme [Paenibacillus sp. TSA_86.1]|uniref:aminotransferase class III-fold pyridoxal phosphate-dependent enzyme n=1 Tax=Paenibacillus sp. TSA_86.1 TaxID=3415649 RepID=UPI004045AB07